MRRSGVSSFSLNKIRKILSREKKDVLVEYFTTKDNVYVFMISREVLRVEKSPLPREKLRCYCDSYLKKVVDYAGNYDIESTWLELSSHLIEPISKELSTADFIYFIPHGLLHYLPLHALELWREPVIKQHPVAYSPLCFYNPILQRQRQRIIESLLFLRWRFSMGGRLRSRNLRD